MCTCTASACVVCGFSTPTHLCQREKERADKRQKVLARTYPKVGLSGRRCCSTVRGASWVLAGQSVACGPDTAAARLQRPRDVGTQKHFPVLMLQPRGRVLRRRLSRKWQRLECVWWHRHGAASFDNPAAGFFGGCVAVPTDMRGAQGWQVRSLHPWLSLSKWTVEERSSLAWHAMQSPHHGNPATLSQIPDR